MAKTKEGQNLISALKAFIEVTLPLERLEQSDILTKKQGNDTVLINSLSYEAIYNLSRYRRSV